MSPLEAVAILDQATDPRNAGKLTRGDYAATQEALRVISQALSPAAPSVAAPPGELLPKAKAKP